MADGSDEAEQSLQDFQAGDILLWLVEPAGGLSALERAWEMGDLADAHGLGRWGAFERGLGGTAFFDLTLDEPVNRLLAKLIFGALPTDVY